MGNQLAGVAPQIYPLEHYFSGLIDMTFDSNMGSTRFFKVARAKCEEGLVVVKVFVKHDHTLPLEEHKNRIEYIRNTLANAVNCVPFKRVEITEKAAYILRGYVKDSLYDRLSTRPFLTVLEKKWITFQILCALNQCHKQKICHGDIKLENILITSWNWIFLSDFASFKPTYLPEDNPADYTYFFDTSRRRTCCIAPERFVKNDQLISNADGYFAMGYMRMDPNHSENTLLPTMDIFSTGCALLELWTEGTAPFELSQLLAYRRGETELAQKHLQSIENDDLRRLLSSMIDLHSMNRKSAEVYLDEERGRLFPEYFYSFLQPYIQMFSSRPIMTPDDKIQRLYSDIEHCIKTLTSTNDARQEDEVDDKDKKDTEQNESATSLRLAPEEDGLILIITVVTSCIRGLKQSNTKICSLELLEKLSKYSTSETILDRILPYILHLAEVSSANVQAQAIETLTTCLSLVKEIPRSDANVFPDYIFTSIRTLSIEQSAVIVRVAFARNIGKLAKIAIYFLEETQRNSPNDMPTQLYETELDILRGNVQEMVLSLLTDSRAIVKQTLVESGICDLCAFFGKEKANDVILSHIMTFLNDEDKNLRGSFYDNIAGVAGYVGSMAADILVPLLQQGFTDREEFVIAKAIRAITILIELGHIKKPTVTEILKESACYLCHPNIWIRHEICGMISTTARTLSAIDVQCKIIPAIGKFLKTPLIQVEKPDILLDCLLPPIPRQIYDSVLRFQDIKEFLHALGERAEVRESTNRGASPQYDEKSQTLRNLFRRLSSEGLNDTVEMQLLAMEPFLLKLKYHEPTLGNGRIVIKRNQAECHEYYLGERVTKSPIEPRVSDGITPTVVSPASDVVVAPVGGGSINSSSPGVLTLGGPQITVSATTSFGEYTLPDRNYWQERSSECGKELDMLCTKMKSRYRDLANSQYDNIERNKNIYPSDWRLNGVMVAHLHEHSESVIKMTSLKPHGSLFASGSLDGTVRLWDCNKLNGNHGINKSRQVYSANTPIYSLAACDGGESLAVGGKDSSLLIMRIDRNSSKMTLQQALHLDQNEQNDGPVVDMHSSDQASQSVIIYATLYGAIVAWDTRMQHSAWRLQNELRNGVISSICADSTNSWLATGTSSGKHICWDLRFRLPVAEIRHPHGSWIRKVACHPTEPSCLISASQVNNEISIWNIETGHRQTVLWASVAPPLSNTNNSDFACCGILSGVTNNSPFILAGSSDQRIRLWDINTPGNSALIVPSPKDNLKDIAFTYDANLIDGSQVIREEMIPLGNAADSIRGSTEEIPRSGPDMPSASHHDAITDLLMCKTDKGQVYVASAARDGVMKLWK